MDENPKREQPFTIRELDNLFGQLHHKIDRHRQSYEEKLDEVMQEVKKTNGRLRRVEIAIIAIIAFSAGIGINYVGSLLVAFL